MIVRVAHGVAGAISFRESHGPIVVIDALRMSATVIVALHLGMEVIPVATEEEAMAVKDKGGFTAGERGGERLSGLDLGNSPTELLALERSSGDLSGKALALTTSNGVPALLAVADYSGAVLIGSPLNLSALATRINREALQELSLLLAGVEEGKAAQEDAMTASLLLERLDGSILSTLPSPIPVGDLETLFSSTPSGQKLVSLGYEEDVRLCASVDRYPVVPVFRAGRVTV
jgi:2-phosphosulfolactate phosphatase